MSEETAKVLLFRAARFRTPIEVPAVAEHRSGADTAVLPDNVISLALARSLRRARPRFTGPPEGEAA